MVKKLKRAGYWVRGVDIKVHEFAPTQADQFNSVLQDFVGSK